MLTAPAALAQAARGEAAPTLWPQVIVERPHLSTTVGVSAQSEDGRFLATSDGNVVKVWRLPERKLLTEYSWNSVLRTIYMLKYPVRMAFDASGDRLAILTTETDAMWDGERELRTAGLHPVAVLDLVRGEAKRLKLTPRSLNSPGHGLRHEFTGLGWSGDDVVTLSDNGSLTAWSSETGGERLVRQLPWTRKGWSGLSADARLAVYGDVLYRVEVGPTDITFERVEEVAPGPAERARSGRPAPVRTDLADRGWKIPPPVTAALGPPIVRDRKQTRVLASWATAKDGALVARATARGVAVLDLATGASASYVVSRPVLAQQFASDVVPAPLLAISSTGAVALFRAPAPSQTSMVELFPDGVAAPPQTVEVHGPPRRVLFSPAGNELWVVFERGDILVINPRDGQVLRRAPPFVTNPDSSGVVDARWLPEGLLISVHDGFVGGRVETKLVDGTLRRPARDFPAHFSSDRDPQSGRWLVSEYGDLALEGKNGAARVLTESGAGNVMVMSLPRHRRVASCSGTIVVVTDLDSKQRWQRAPHGSDRTMGLAWGAGGQAVVSYSEDADELSFWFIDDGRQVIVRPQGDGRALGLFSSEGFYWSRGTGGDEVRFRVKDRVYPFEQFDLIMNRPDRVLAMLGFARKETLDLYGRAWRKRLGRMRLDPARFEKVEIDALPTLRLVNELPKSRILSGAVTLELSGQAGRGSLSRIFVEVNGVPLFGVAGRALSGAVWNDTLPIPLGRGRNDIRASVLDDRGLESLAVTVNVEQSGTQHRIPTLHTVAIGVSHFADSRYDLRFAAKDAGDVTDAFAAAAKKRGMAHERHLLLDSSATRDAVLALRPTLEATGVDDEVVVFIATHGMLDDALDYHLALHETDFSTPAKGSLRYEDIEALLDEIPARSKLVLLDACHAGEADADDGPAELVMPDGIARARGFVRPGGPRRSTMEKLRGQTPVQARDLFVDLRRHNGAMVIAAAAGREWALESDVWANGVFTATVVEAIRDHRADGDGDRRVKVLELSTYVADRVRELTAGRQNPNARAVNRRNDFIVAE